VLGIATRGKLQVSSRLNSAEENLRTLLLECTCDCKYCAIRESIKQIRTTHTTVGGGGGGNKQHKTSMHRLPTFILNRKRSMVDDTK
jgi:hypothetical protein